MKRFNKSRIKASDYKGETILNPDPRLSRSPVVIINEGKRTDARRDP